MASFDAQTPTDPDRPLGGKAAARGGLTADGGSSTVTYYYRTSAGARGSTTDLGAIPALAVIERTVTV